MSLILVIEDVQRVRAHIVEILRFEDFTVHGVPDAEAGLQLARSLEPDLILCDIGLPNMDGFELLELLRQDPACSTIPFIFLSARGDREAVRKGMSMGANDYISKPFDGEELIAAVRARLEQRASERRSTLGEMHDHLGSLLTDIDLSVRLMLHEVASAPPDKHALQGLSLNVREAMAAFRDGLATANDLMLVERNFLDGLHLIVVRRYALFNRRLRFVVSEDPVGIVQASGDVWSARPLFLMIQELVTNDLKYGAGDTVLSIAADEGQLAIQLESAARSDRNSGGGTGLGLKSIANRLNGLHGTLRIEKSDSAFAARIEIPATREGQSNER